MKITNLKNRTVIREGFLSLVLGLLLVWSSAGCGLLQPAVSTIAPAPTASTTPPLETRTLTMPPSPTALPATATLLPSLTPEPSLTSTPDPYAPWTIETLLKRSYGGGEIQDEQTLAVTSAFTRTLISYPSDGLKIYGFMNEPKGEGPFPLIIAIHGYIDPAIYQTLDYTTGNADALARAGFMVIHPNLRGYFPSDSGENLFRVGMAEDILNLIQIVKDTGGKPGVLAKADPDSIGLWGHSMGGGITTRVVTVNPDVKAAVLYGAMSGDERRNYEAINRWSNGLRGLEELAVPQDALPRISPINFLDQIQAAISIHHGGSDELVPLAWSLETCERLQTLKKTVECFTYDGQPHTFSGDGGELFNQRVIDFFNRYLVPQ